MSVLRKLPPVLGRDGMQYTYSVVTRAWEGRTVVCIGGGPSLTVDQVSAVFASGHPAIAVNDAYLLAPWAAINYFCDYEWWDWHRTGVPFRKLGLTAAEVATRFAAFQGQKCSISNSGHGITDPEVHILKDSGDYGLSTNPEFVRNGRNSGFQALNVAVLAGARKVVLIGYDAHDALARPGETHWFGEHPKQAALDVYAKYRRSFSAAENELTALGVTVLNASPGSAIDSFPKVALEEALR